MKQLITIWAGILFSCIVLNAQQYDVLDIVKADVRKSYGMEGPHRLDEFSTMSKAPAGYKPFYISHYGRHGSRYAWNADTYTFIRDVFKEAEEKDFLTPVQGTYYRWSDFRTLTDKILKEHPEVK